MMIAISIKRKEQKGGKGFSLSLKTIGATDKSQSSLIIQGGLLNPDSEAVTSSKTTKQCKQWLYPVA